METNRVMQLAGLIFCLVLILSEFCYCYPPTYYTSSDEDNVEQGIREMLEDWERQGVIRTLMPSNKAAYHLHASSRGILSNGHEIMTRKIPRSGSTSNLRLRYGKRSLPMPSPYGFMSGGGGVGNSGAENVKGGGGGAFGKTGNWKVQENEDGR